MPLVVFVALIAVCNLMILSAIAAGGSEIGWSQRLTLAAELMLLMLAIVVAGLLVWVTGVTEGRTIALLAVVALVVAIALAGVLTYFEYMLAGHRQRFGRDLRRSMWVVRGGTTRLADRGDPQVTSSAQQVSSALARGDLSAVAASLRELAGPLDGDQQLASAITDLDSASQELRRQAEVTAERKPRRLN